MTEENLAPAASKAHDLRMVRFPRSCPSRKSTGHLRLVSSVDLSAPAGLQLRGRFVLPGAKLELDALPRPAVVLEHAGRVADPAAKTHAERRRSFADLWILWRFDFETSGWVEVVRTTAVNAAFQLEFAPIAARLLNDEGHAVPAAQARPAASRVICSIEAELAEVSGDTGCYVLAEIETYLANQIVRRIEQRSARMIEQAGERFLAA